ncbi:coiled-coil domain-containing protein [Wolbachia endosymbiont of Pentidionis agamae]|uniref:hypothetical protein n=1 Tax=Wolbachia endosymbiont of Pentidionis agamae TaxID=3110435 RepID=UPI002FD394E0
MSNVRSEVRKTVDKITEFNNKIKALEKENENINNLQNQGQIKDEHANSLLKVYNKNSDNIKKKEKERSKYINKKNRFFTKNKGEFAQYFKEELESLSNAMDSDKLGQGKEIFEAQVKNLKILGILEQDMISQIMKKIENTNLTSEGLKGIIDATVYAAQHLEESSLNKIMFDSELKTRLAQRSSIDQLESKEGRTTQSSEQIHAQQPTQASKQNLFNKILNKLRKVIEKLKEITSKEKVIEDSIDLAESRKLPKKLIREARDLTRNLLDIDLVESEKLFKEFVRDARDSTHNLYYIDGKSILDTLNESDRAIIRKLTEQIGVVENDGKKLFENLKEQADLSSKILKHVEEKRKLRKEITELIKKSTVPISDNKEIAEKKQNLSHIDGKIRASKDQRNKLVETVKNNINQLQLAGDELFSTIMKDVQKGQQSIESKETQKDQQGGRNWLEKIIKQKETKQDKGRGIF